MQKLNHILKAWLPLAVLTTAFCMLVYVSVQQTLRNYANDPQIQLVQDAAITLANSGTTAAVVPSVQIDVARSLAPFIMVFNDQGSNLATSGLLHGKPPALPAGILDYVRKNGEDRVTWQPEPGVRIAAVVTSYQGVAPGFVLAGRSLREVEMRESQVQTFAGATWLLSLLATLVVVAFGEFFLAPKN